MALSSMVLKGPGSPIEGIHPKPHVIFLIHQHPQLPFKRPQIPSNTDHKALYRGTLRGVGRGVFDTLDPYEGGTQLARSPLSR